VADLPSWLHWLESCPSTNTWAIDHAAALIHGDVVYTPKQTAGRGQYGHHWESPPGVLTASFVIDRVPVDRLSGFSLVMGLGVVQAIEGLVPEVGGRLKLKWPNDVWLEDRKVAGLLCESAWKPGAIFTRVVVGVGLNCEVDFVPEQLAMMAGAQVPISLHQVVPNVPSPQQFLESIRSCLLQFNQRLWFPLQESNLEMFGGMLRSRDALFGKSVTIEVGNDVVVGEAVGIDGAGRLLIKISNGEVRSIASGRIVGID
jgi:BirA family transcriptional regulator, biotin operon repressor / biotin---[acetyl-CoA-carboxylase] ligase